MKKNIFILVLSLFTMISHAQNTEWKITSSSVKFKIKNAGITVEGEFTGLDAKIYFDAAKSYSNSIESSVDAKTINTGNGTRDKHLKKEEYFSIEKFPKIRLSSTTFAKQNDGSFKGYFKLTLKSVSKDIVIPFTFIESNKTAIINGSFVINRLDFGIGESSLILSNNVIITIEATLTKN